MSKEIMNKVIWYILNIQPTLIQNNCMIWESSFVKDYKVKLRDDYVVKIYYNDKLLYHFKLIHTLGKDIIQNWIYNKNLSLLNTYLASGDFKDYSYDRIEKLMDCMNVDMLTENDGKVYNQIT
jgi:hypothetical protein